MGDKLTVQLSDELQKRFKRFLDEEPVKNKSEATRALLDEGLRSAGYEPEFRTEAARLLGIVRGFGSAFGIAGLFLLVVGQFLPVFSRFGLGLLMIGVAFLCGAEIADHHGEAIMNWVKQKARDEADMWLNPAEEETDG